MDFFAENPTDNIEFRCGDFTGSIHLLVSLCRSRGETVYTVKITDLIDQYMDYIAGLEDEHLNMELASDFLLTASKLLLIKSRALLPVDEEELKDDEEYLDPEEELRRRMIEHELFSEKAQIIKKNETLNRFYREPIFTESDARLSIKGFDLDKLMRAFATVMYKFTKTEEFVELKTIEKDEYTVAQKIDLLIESLSDKKVVKFDELFENARSKNEIINTFLALLQLMGKQFAIVKQECNFGEITIEINPECDIENYDYSVLAVDEEEIKE